MDFSKAQHNDLMWNKIINFHVKKLLLEDKIECDLGMNGQFEHKPFIKHLWDIIFCLLFAWERISWATPCAGWWLCLCPSSVTEQPLGWCGSALGSSHLGWFAPQSLFPFVKLLNALLCLSCDLCHLICTETILLSERDNTINLPHLALDFSLRMYFLSHIPQLLAEVVLCWFEAGQVAPLLLMVFEEKGWLVLLSSTTFWM